MTSIYHIVFDLSDFGLNAVIVANSHSDAIEALGLMDEVVTSCTAIGAWMGPPIDKPVVISRESL
jgi:hypothetical protein